MAGLPSRGPLVQKGNPARRRQSVARPCQEGTDQFWRKLPVGRRTFNPTPADGRKELDESEAALDTPIAPW